ncbi:MAG: GspH/FimT family pseudopilin [Pseudomonadota bacterium]
MIQRGVTLVELMVTLAVAAVLMALALPAFDALLDRERGTAALNQIIGAVRLGRTEAIIRGRPVTLCPAADGACLGRDQWHRGALVFTDDAADGEVGPEDTVLTALPPLRQGERVYWRSFRNRTYLRFQPRGYTAWQNGSFLYCPPDADVRRARMVIVNAQGRVRVAADADGDGVAEDAAGRALVCPP